MTAEEGQGIFTTITNAIIQMFKTLGRMDIFYPNATVYSYFRVLLHHRELRSCVLSEFRDGFVMWKVPGGKVNDNRYHDYGGQEPI